MKIVFLVGVGSFFGGILRFIISNNIKAIAFPYGTLTVNILGCFIIGLLISLFSKISIEQVWQQVLLIGFCGGFTTFSAFSIETFMLFKSGQAGVAFA